MKRKEMNNSYLQENLTELLGSALKFPFSKDTKEWDEWIENAKGLYDDAVTVGTKYSMYVRKVTKIIENGGKAFRGNALVEFVMHFSDITENLNPSTVKLKIGPSMTIAQVSRIINGLKFFKKCSSRYLVGGTLLIVDDKYMKDMFTEEYKYFRTAL